jgi:hypothetical protein
MNFMDDATAKKGKARRTIILLYAFMAVGIALPLVFWWLRR